MEVLNEIAEVDPAADTERARAGRRADDAEILGHLARAGAPRGTRAGKIIKETGRSGERGICLTKNNSQGLVFPGEQENPELCTGTFTESAFTY